MVRAVPEMAFCYYPSRRHIKAYGPYDWEYMTRYVLPHVNTIVSRQQVPEEQFIEWLKEGRRWISNASLPGLSSKAPPTADAVCETWSKNAGVAQDGFSGLIVDEFLDSSEGHYAAWTDATRRILEMPAFEGRRFYAWCSDLYKHPPGLAFSRMLVEAGQPLVWERYLREAPTPETARAMLDDRLRKPFERWREALPGVEQHMVMCLGYLCAPPETLNADPRVNYHVFMDMQFHYLATEPVFKGLYGVMEYMAAYADEESIRWAHNLFRHYGIDGKTDRYTEDPYVLEHVTNPDFADGLNGWEVRVPEKGSVEQGKREGFSWLQGRYPRTPAGDTFCLMRRSPRGVNLVRQVIRGLEPGRPYSLKLISTDLQRMGLEQLLGLHIYIGGAERLRQYEFQVPYGSSYSHTQPPYDRDHPAYFNYHRVVFRPKANRAELVIADWRTKTEPGGPLEQELAFNFIEVQPFLEP